MARARNVQTAGPNIQEVVSMSGFDDTPTLAIKNREFLRDLRYALRSHIAVAIGQLDEAIANGLGFNSRAALLAEIKKASPLRVVVQEQRFRERLDAFQASAPEGLFVNCVLDLISNANCDVFVGFQGEQVKALGRVKVRLNRVPSEEELEQNWLEYESFMPAFQKCATKTDPMVAIAIDIGGAIDLDGYHIPIGGHNTWLTLIGPVR